MIVTPDQPITFIRLMNKRSKENELTSSAITVKSETMKQSSKIVFNRIEMGLILRLLVIKSNHSNVAYIYVYTKKML